LTLRLPQTTATLYETGVLICHGNRDLTGGYNFYRIPTSMRGRATLKQSLVLTFLIIVTIITSSHYILFSCNFIALRKRLICPAIANEPTTDMLFLLLFIISLIHEVQKRQRRDFILCRFHVQ